jgi:excisionase family DNA binding protein
MADETTPAMPDALEDEFFTVEEVRKRLRVHADTVRRWIRAGRLPGTMRFGIEYRIPRTALEKFAESTAV